MESPRWRFRPEGSNWGDFGPDDQVGRLNLLTPEKVKQGIAEVKEGISFCLSMPLDYPGENALLDRRHPPVIRPTIRQNRPNMNFVDDNPEKTDVFCDDLVIMHTQYSTQWDGLSHVGQLFDADGDGTPEPRFYNGFRGGIDIVGPASVQDAGVRDEMSSVSTSRANALGIEKMAEKCVQGRGVMVDLKANVGESRTLVGYDTFMRVLEADKIVVEPGDMVCLHIGFADCLLKMNRKPVMTILNQVGAVLDGRDSKLLQWITDSGLSVLIADNFAVEMAPGGACSGRCAAMPLHEHCLFKLGIHLGELWHLTALAEWLRAKSRSRFLLTAPPLRLPGAVGSPVTPIATV